MTNDGPYRTATREACPRCHGPMLPGGGQLRTCASGCGDWAPAEVVAERWGDIIYTPTVAKRWWRDDARGVDCATCHQPMKPIAHDGWRVYRCTAHGAWLEPGVRARIEKQFGAEIQLHLQVKELTAAVRGGDEAAITDLVRRLLALEQQVELLRKLVRGP